MIECIFIEEKNHFYDIKKKTELSRLFAFESPSLAL